MSIICFKNDFSTFQDCTDNAISSAIERFYHFNIKTSTLDGTIESIELKQGHSFDVNQYTMIINPIICYAGM